MDYQHIASDADLGSYVQGLAAARSIGFDSEFVSEDTFRPELCLIQVVADGRLAVIDPFEVRDLTPFWRVLCEGDHETVVHAGREELLFCLSAVGKRPKNLVDIQIAAGLVGYEYPAGYGSLTQKLLGVRPDKGETRTDWRKRPISARQLEYALNDVRYLQPMWDNLREQLQSLNRIDWLATEMADWQDEIEQSRHRERFWRVSGIAHLSSRNLAIVRELSRWREAEAERRNIPLRRILRDDLLVELAKRRSADPKQIGAIRGMERPELRREYDRIAKAIARALELPDAECPTVSHREWPTQITLIGQFLSSALASICRAAQVAPSIVGTASDVRDLVAHLLGWGEAGDVPVLGRGWRADVVGNKIHDLLGGKLAIRIGDPLSDEPLLFQSVDGK